MPSFTAILVLFCANQEIVSIQLKSYWNMFCGGISQKKHAHIHIYRYSRGSSFWKACCWRLWRVGRASRLLILITHFCVIRTSIGYFLRQMNGITLRPKDSHESLTVTGRRRKIFMELLVNRRREDRTRQAGRQPIRANDVRIEI